MNPIVQQKQFSSNLFKLETEKLRVLIWDSWIWAEKESKFLD